MNKIILDNLEIYEQLDENIKVDYQKKEGLFAVSKLNITIKNDTDLNLIYNNDILLDVVIDVCKNVNSHIYQKSLANNIKVKYELNVEDNSLVHFDKFTNSKTVKELVVVNLNGINSKIIFNQKTIANNSEKYDLLVSHNNKSTKCLINNNGITIKDGEITFNVTNIVSNKMENATINQNSRIVNMNNKNSIINPNLLIDENNVEANHSAYIGPFKEEEIFYLQSRAIDLDKAYNLLIKGFILNGMLLTDDNKIEIKHIIDENWR